MRLLRIDPWQRPPNKSESKGQSGRKTSAALGLLEGTPATADFCRERIERTAAKSLPKNLSGKGGLRQQRGPGVLHGAGNGTATRGTRFDCVAFISRWGAPALF